MLKISQVDRIHVYRPKRKATGDPTKMGARDLTLVGKAHLTVFDPTGRRVVGFLVKRPDVASMIKVSDAFIALDSLAVCDLGFVATRGDESFDDKARDRLGLDWDRCLIWVGMDAKTTDGKELGWVSDVEFSPKTGKVKTFFIGDGNVSAALVGTIEVPVEMLRGYRDGYMLVDPAAAKLALDGGAAAKAGEAYGRAKYNGAKAAKKISSSAGKAVERGAYGFGKMMADTKKAFEESSADERPAAQEVKSISEPMESSGGTAGEEPKLREFVPVSEAGETEAKPEKAVAKRPAAKKEPAKRKSSGENAARALGKQLGKTKGMFGAFVSEYKKASK